MTKLTRNAQVALFGARHKHVWGRAMALRYVINKGGSVALYRLACQLQAASKSL